MEIFTILKANIRHKKGSFGSILILMTVISMALTSVLSVWDNIYGGIVDVHERENTGNVVCMIEKNKLSEQLVSDVEDHSLVKEVKAEETIDTIKVTYKDYDYENSVFVRELESGYRLFNAKGTGYLYKAPELKKGEIYISRGMETKFSCEIGETLTITFVFGSYDFKIAGIIEDPEMGASVIGWKNVFICPQDYKELYSEAEAAARSEEGLDSIITQFSIYKNDDCNLRDAKFARQLNLDTGIADMSFGALTREMSIYYTSLFPKTICVILTVFSILLLAAVVVIICHSVSTGIEMEYTTLGIMKAQGFVKGKMQIILVAQYLLAQIIGALLGTFAAIPLCGVIANVFHPITGSIPRRAISIGKCGCILLAVLLVSVLCIVMITRRIAKISPVRAIQGGKGEVYFESRIRMAIHKRMLSASLALRQFTSNKKQYVGVMVIVAILVYFMTTMMVLTGVITATSAWEAMGISYSDLDIELKKEISDSRIAEIEETIRGSSSFETAYKSCGNYYFSVDGEQMIMCIYSEPEYIKAVSKGRIPLYDNEIVMTQIAADNLDLRIGDKVVIGFEDKKEEYIISGFNQHENDAGVNASMTMAAVSKFGDVRLRYLGYVLEDKSKGNQIADELNEKYGDILSAEFNENPMEGIYQLAINAMTLVVYIFSVIFAMVVVHMVCSKAFLRERRDIGIYKALGFTAAKLRLQFAVRFSIIAVIGAVVGSVLAALFVGKMLSSLLRMIGISSFHTTFHVYTFAVPITMICVCFFAFAYVASRRIRSVEVKELIVE